MVVYGPLHVLASSLNKQGTQFRIGGENVQWNALEIVRIDHRL